MLCDICQVNEATILYTEIMNGTRREKHLCEACAAKYTGLDSKHFAVVPGGMLANLLANMIMNYDSELSDNDIKKTNFVCPSCGMTYNEFLKYGKLGCHDCYKTFGLILDPCLMEMQGSSRHVGTAPEGQQVFVEIPELKPMEKAQKVQAQSGKQGAAQTGTPAVQSPEIPDDPKALASGTLANDRTSSSSGTQGSEQRTAAGHIGDVDAAQNPEDIRDVGQLKKRLAEAIEREEYEEAAKIRDLIKSLDAANEAVKHE